MMKLRFIGVDGTYGLKKGEIYDVDMFTQGSYIWARWSPTTGPGCTGYLSPKAFANNWESV
jgi:hypothetical protein